MSLVRPAFDETIASLASTLVGARRPGSGQRLAVLRNRVREVDWSTREVE
jgi:hypothetical protein